MFNLIANAAAAAAAPAHEAGMSLLPASVCVVKEGENPYGLLPALCEGGIVSQITFLVLLIMFIITVPVTTHKVPLDLPNGPPSVSTPDVYRLELDAAIDALPDDQRRVVGLLRQGFQIDSKDPNIMTIAKMLQCDERTVRNRRDRAYKTLRSVLQEDA